MNTVAFARHRSGSVAESQRISHVVELDPESSLITALCGRQFPPGALELVPQWAGMPCVACTLRLPMPREPEPAPVPRPDRPPAPSAGDHVLAAAFTDEPLAHLLPEDTPRIRSRGEFVAVAACGHLVRDWTDGTAPPPPGDWPLCAECTDAAAITVPDGDQPSDCQPSNEQPGGDKRSNDKPSGDQLRGDRPTGNSAGHDRPWSDWSRDDWRWNDEAGPCSDDSLPA